MRQGKNCTKPKACSLRKLIFHAKYTVFIPFNVFNPFVFFQPVSKSDSALLWASGQKASGVDNGFIVIHARSWFCVKQNLSTVGMEAGPVGGSCTKRVVSCSVYTLFTFSINWL
jgi:hypothetical protein